MKIKSTVIFIFFSTSFIFGQATEIVDVIATGIGVDKSEAQVAALRNAVEQAFGAFISSKTEILNDELVKDEVVSISNGNIQSFEEIAFILIDSGEYMTTLKASVSLSSLATFVRAKGYADVSFNGSGFAMNIKLKKRNAEAELEAINNILQVGLQLCKKFYQPIIAVSEPYAINSERYAVPLTMKLKSTQQWSDFLDYMIASFEGIELKSSELSGYDKVNLDYYKFTTFQPGTKWFEKNQVIDGYSIFSTHYFRNRQSIDLIRAFFLSINVKAILSPKITNGVDVFGILDKYGLAHFGYSENRCFDKNTWCLVFENDYCKKMLFETTEYSDTTLRFDKVIKRKDRIRGKYYERIYDTINIHPYCRSYFRSNENILVIGRLLTGGEMELQSKWLTSIRLEMYSEDTDLSRVLNLNNDMKAVEPFDEYGNRNGILTDDNENEFNYWITPDNLLRFDIELIYTLDELAQISSFILVD